MSSKDMLVYAGNPTFWGLPETRDVEGKDITIMGVPFDVGVTNRPGARFGPRSVREISIHDMKTHYPWRYDVKEKLDMADYGDVGYDIGIEQTSQMIEETYRHAGKIFGSGSKLLTIGGDHTIPYGMVRAAKEKYGKLSLLHIDSHQDSIASEGVKISHASFAHDLAEEGAIDAEKSVQAYIRTEMPNEFNYNIIYANEAMSEGPKALAEKVKSIIGDNPVYLSFDVDSLDPAFAPGTGTPVPGGPSTQEMRLFLSNLKGLNVVAADLVEVSPSYDTAQVTALAGASVAKDLIYLMAEKIDD
ncbi:agmatinase [Salinicoccus halitifaciens]|uniref:Agmatinase n=1 Tax=Salinicoccus halitifaciens TaxID=1073415 RepID=A0ABV2EAT6_9STAP|nr:agmatinase [Salinicoccus halitifaciens]MCD2137610.1 agmatinase [Salinicoccus halitifaciens]